MLKCRIHHGKSRLKDASELESVDIVLTTYQTLVAELRRGRGSSLPYSVSWRRVILDEGKTLAIHQRADADWLLFSSRYP